MSNYFYFWGYYSKFLIEFCVDFLYFLLFLVVFLFISAYSFKLRPIVYSLNLGFMFFYFRCSELCSFMFYFMYAWVVLLLGLFFVDLLRQVYFHFTLHSILEMFHSFELFCNSFLAAIFFHNAVFTFVSSIGYLLFFVFLYFSRIYNLSKGQI